MNDSLIQYACQEKNQVDSNIILFDLKQTIFYFVDKIVHYSDSHHIAVYHKGRWFKVFMFYKNNLLQPCELQLYAFFECFIRYDKF